MRKPDQRQLEQRRSTHQGLHRAKEKSLPATRVQPSGYVSIRDVAAIRVKAHCGNCMGEEDLMYHEQLHWLLCRHCRVTYTQAINGLDLQARLGRGYAPQGAHFDWEHEA